MFSQEDNFLLTFNSIPTKDILPPWLIDFLIFQIFHKMNIGTALYNSFNFGVVFASNYLRNISLNWVKGPTIPTNVWTLLHNLLAIGHWINKCAIISYSLFSQHFHRMSTQIFILMRISPIRVIYFHILYKMKEIFKSIPFTHNCLNSSWTSLPFLVASHAELVEKLPEALRIHHGLSHSLEYSSTFNLFQIWLQTSFRKIWSKTFVSHLHWLKTDAHIWFGNCHY